MSIQEHKRAFVLMSGGVDSTTCLFKALKQMGGDPKKVVAFGMDYGQLHVKELEQAKAICDNYGIEHRILDIKGFAQGPLTDKPEAIPDCSYDEIEGMSPTYMPFRNGFMLSRLAAEAQSYALSVQRLIVEEIKASVGDDPAYDEAVAKVDDLEDLVWIYFGAHAEDAESWAYPDCTPEFVGSMANAVYIGTYRTVRVKTPFIESSKDEIIRAGYRLGVPYEMTWSCYKGLELHCGTCPTCLARKEAFKLAEVEDPTKYAA